MNTATKLIIAALPLCFSGAALAGADCTTEAQDKWMPRAEMQKRIFESGYTIDRFKVDGNCYEIYGRNADDRKVEVYFNPVTGEVVKEEVES